MLLVIDNFDSFTFNLVQYLGELGTEMTVRRNHEVEPSYLDAQAVDAVLISPGPCSPNEAGNSIAMVQASAERRLPLFGVCLGHQCIGQYFGGRIVRADRLMHGKVSPIEHGQTELFEGLPVGFKATRYHSLLIAPDSVPECLEVTARTDLGEIMGIRHKFLPIWGVQFHPESLATEFGYELVQNFLRLAGLDSGKAGEKRNGAAADPLLSS